MNEYVVASFTHGQFTAWASDPMTLDEAQEFVANPPACWPRQLSPPIPVHPRHRMRLSRRHLPHLRTRHQPAKPDRMDAPDTVRGGVMTLHLPRTLWEAM